MLNIQSEGEDRLRKILSNLKSNKNKLLYRLNKAFGEQVVTIMKDKYLSAAQGNSQYLHNKTGGLVGSAYLKANSKRAIYGTTKKYGPVHEFGPTVITPKTKKFLAFQINGKWIFTKKVTIPKREYARPARDDFFEKKLYIKVSDRVLRQYLKEQL